MYLVRIAMLLIMATSPTVADIIDFENLPSAYMYLGGGQNIGSFYAGVDFGPNVTGLDLTGSTAFPPHSGSIAVWDPTDLTVTISFENPQTAVGLWYTSFDLLTFASYDDTDTLISSVTAQANTDGTTGTSDFVSLTAPDISSVTLAGSPGDFVFDDLTFSANASTVPEPITLPPLLCFMLLLLTGRMRANVYSAQKRYVQQSEIEARQVK
jgi:hypothetical protein